MKKLLVLLVILLLSMRITAIQEQEQNTENSTLTTFMSSWNTTLTSTISSDSNQIKLPLESDGNYNFVVNWGDDTSDTITSWDQAEVTHTYSSEGIYNVTIDGIFEGWSFNNGGDKYKIIDISQWGDVQLGNNGGYFYGAKNLQISAIDAPDLSETINLNDMFLAASTFNQPIGNWNVSGVTDMGSMFAGTSFNQDISRWDVSSVTDTSNMFSGSSFNQDISNWDVSSVTDMQGMFARTYFNQDIGDWDVSGVKDMHWMFDSATSFNQSIGDWDVSGVKDMRYMFIRASSFNSDISNWDVSGVVNMRSMFSRASSFNQDIGNWNISKVYDMSSMFNSVTLSSANYDNLLINWAELPLRSGVIFDAGNSLYSDKSAASRQSIIDNFRWTITDGGHVDALSPTSNGTSTDTISLSETEDSEDAFLNTFHFFSQSSLLVIIIIRIGRRKNKNNMKRQNL